MKKISLLVVAAFFAVLLVPAAFAQTGTVKGTIVDENGKPIVGAKVEMVSKDTGRKYDLKSDSKGQIFSLGIAPGTYDVTVTNANGQLLTKYSNYPVKLDENKLDVDMAKERAHAQQSMSEEQKKEIEAVQKENLKIKSLNDKLAAAKVASDAGNFDQAVQILTEATQVDPTRDLLWLKLGDAQRSAGLKATDPAQKKADFEGSLASYKKALEITGTTGKPDVVGAVYNNMADSYARLGQIDDAIKSYDQAAQVNPAGAGAYYFNEGAVFTNTGRVDDAIKAFDKAIAADPEKAAAYYWKGVNMMGKATLQGNKMVAPDGTAEAFNKYLELEPTGQFADPAKQMLASIGASVETSFGKGKKAPAKKK
jgi:tetratricopeptide (TPR) repeat protein